MSRKKTLEKFVVHPPLTLGTIHHSCFKRESFLLVVFPHPNSSKLIVYLHFLYTSCLHLKLRIRIIDIFCRFTPNNDQCLDQKRIQLSSVILHQMLVFITVTLFDRCNSRGKPRAFVLGPGHIRKKK